MVPRTLLGGTRSITPRGGHAAGGTVSRWACPEPASRLGAFAAFVERPLQGWAFHFLGSGTVSSRVNEGQATTLIAPYQLSGPGCRLRRCYAADVEDGQLVEPGCTPAHSRRARAAGSAVWMTTVQSPPTLEPARGVELREVSPRPGRTTVALGLRACRGPARPTVRR